MRPIFPRKNLALNQLIEFREGKNIFDFTDYIRRPEEERGGWEKENLEFQYNHVIELFELLRDEINQTIHTSNSKTIIAFFEELKNDIEQNNLLNTEKIHFEEVAKNWNNKTYQEFLEKIALKEKSYFEQPERNYKHLEKYNKTIWSWLTHKTETYIEENKNFYCVEEIPELIDLSVLDKYLKILSHITEKFESAINPELKLYNEGKVVSFEDSESNYDKTIRVIKNNKFVVAILLLFVLYGGISSIIKDTKENKENIKELFPIDSGSVKKKNIENSNNQKQDSTKTVKTKKKINCP